MKTKIAVPFLIVFFAFAIVCAAQDNPTTTTSTEPNLDANTLPPSVPSDTATTDLGADTLPPSAAPDTATMSAEPVAETTPLTPSAAPDTATTSAEPVAEATPVTPSAAPDAATTSAEPVVEATPVTPSAAPDTATTSTEPAVEATPLTPSAVPDTTNAPTAAAPIAANGIIPLVQFVDAPLTAVIENLMRQAGLNYILDPKINYGQPGSDGKVTPQPSISIRWENLTAEQALSTLLSTYDLQMTEDPKTKIARITLKDPAAAEPLVNKVIQLKFASPSNIVAAAQSALTDKRSRVLPDVRTSQLVIVATEREMNAVTELVNLLDTATKQVLIETKILETTVNPKTSKGIDWTATLKQQNVTFGNGLTSGNTTTTDPGTPVTSTITYPSGREVTYTTPAGQSQNTMLDTVLGNGGLSLNTLSGFSPQTAFLNADGVKIALSFLNNSSDTRVISEPRTVTLDNQKSTIEVGLMYPIVNVSAGTANTAGGSSIAYSNLTVNLDVTPRITANNFVELKVQQSILRLGPQFSSTVGGVNNNVDSFFTRKIDTTVLIPSGNTLVMGGLVSDENTRANIKVPVLGDIPVLGLAFRKDTKERNRQNLIMFITPTIVKDTDFQPASTKFLQSTGKDIAQEEVSAWDSGKPYDWSKPKAKAAPETETTSPVFDDNLAAPVATPTEMTPTSDLNNPSQP